MDIAEKMAADIALAIDGGDWQDAKWFSKFHRDAWIKAVKPYADEIERLRKQIRYQEHREGRIGTHDPICYGYGPSHYECALRKIDMLRELLNADNQTLRLHFGELTLNEMRIVKAAFQWVLIRAELKEGE